MKKALAALALCAVPWLSQATETASFFTVNVTFTPGCKLEWPSGTAMNVQWRAFTGPTYTPPVVFKVKCSTGVTPTAVGIRPLGTTDTPANELWQTDPTLNLYYGLVMTDAGGNYDDTDGKQYDINIATTALSIGRCPTAGTATCDNSSTSVLKKNFDMVVAW